MGSPARPWDFTSTDVDKFKDAYLKRLYFTKDSLGMHVYYYWMLVTLLGSYTWGVHPEPHICP